VNALDDAWTFKVLNDSTPKFLPNAICEHLKGEKTSSNSMALIFAWTGCLIKRGELDKTPEVVEFARKLEAAAVETVENGVMTGDLMLVATPSPSNRKVYTEEFINEVAISLQKKIA